MKSSKIKKLLGLLLAIALLVYCFYDFDFDSVIKAISKIDYYYLIPLVFMEAFIAFVRAVRLKYIIDPVKHVSIVALYPIYCIGMMTNLIMPYLTGQVARIYLLSKKTRLKKAFLVTNTVLEVLFDALTLIGMVMVISLFFALPQNFGAWYIIILAGAILLLYIGLFILSRSRGKSSRLYSFITLKLPVAAKKKIDEIRNSILSGLETLKSTRHFMLVSALSILSWLCQAGIVYLLILAFGFPISIWGAVVITIVVTLMMTIVISPVNIGTFQGATVAALHPFGIDKSSALAFSFLLHIAVYIPPIILGALFSFKEGLTFKQLHDEGEKGVGSIELQPSTVPHKAKRSSSHDE